MKVKTSITLSEEVVAAVDRRTPAGGNRSETIDRLLRSIFAREAPRERDQKDLDAIDAHAMELNEEADDVLGYQFISETR